VDTLYRVAKNDPPYLANFVKSWPIFTARQHNDARHW